MKNENQSHNTAVLTVMSRQYLLPSWPKVLLYLLIGSLLLMAWNAKAIWSQYSSSILVQSNVSLGSLTPEQTWVGRTFDTIFNGRLAQVIFWAFAGCAAYVIVWFIINIFTNVRNDIVADEFVHPRNYNRKGYWESILARKGFLVAVVITLIGFIFTWIRFMPALATVFLAALQPFKLSPGIGDIIGSVLSTAFLVYIFVLLVHITVNSWRTVYTDL